MAYDPQTMEPLLDRAYLLTQELAEETFERIRADRKVVSAQLQPLLDYIEEFLFDPELNVDALRRWSETHDKNVSTRFAKELGVPPWTYITRRRLEVAARVLAASDFDIWRVGTNVGYDLLNTFGRAFKRRYGQSPGAYRREHRTEGSDPDGPARRRSDPEEPSTAGEAAPEPGGPDPGTPDRADLAAGLESLDPIARGLSGEAEPGEALATVRQLQVAQAGIYLKYWDLEPPTPDEELAEQAVARGVWQSLEGMTPEQQRAVVESQSGCRTAAFFHYLLARSYEIGAEDPERGLELARLAPIALEGLVGQLDEPLMRSFEARSSVVLAQALRRTGDRDGTTAAFAAAERALADAGDGAFLPVVVELSYMRSLFLMSEGDYEEAGRVLQAGREAAREIVERMKEDLQSEQRAKAGE